MTPIYVSKKFIGYLKNFWFMFLGEFSRFWREGGFGDGSLVEMFIYGPVVGDF